MPVTAMGFLGECMVELKGDVTATLSHGYAGDTLNTAVYFSRLMHLLPATTYFITALGEDAFSEHMVMRWQEEGIDTRFVKRLPNLLPGIYAIETDNRGERRFHYWRNQSAAKYVFDTRNENDESISELDAIYLSGISLAILSPQSREYLWSLLARIKARGGKVYFDNNFRPALWPNKHEAIDAYNAVLAMCDMAFLTLDDELTLFNTPSAASVLERVARFHIPEVVIKCGAEPCVIREGDALYSIPAIAVHQVIDTTAAGDSFSAAYLAARLQGNDVTGAANYAHQLAARVIQHAGAILPNSSTHAFLTENVL